MTAPLVAPALRALLAIEALAASGIVALLGFLMITQPPSNIPAALFELFFALMVATVLWISVNRDAMRSAVILLNIIALPISRTLAQGDRTLLAIIVALVAFSTLVLLYLDRKKFDS